MSDHQQPEASGSTTSVAQPTPTDSQPPLSKKALKRAAKEELYNARKLERRAREREAKKEKKKLLAQKRAAGVLEDDDGDSNRKAKKRKVEFGGRVVVDLGFDELMNPKEVKSLTSQLAYTYSVNRQASFPFDLVFSSLDGRTLERLETTGDRSYKRWAKTEWWTEGVEKLWGGAPYVRTTAATASAEGQTPVAQPLMVVAEAATESSAAPTERNAIQEKVVYLTADCEEELTELKPDEIYIIGGIVDHNRYKNLCLNKAKALNVRTAKLPIGSFLANMPTRKVLTVNQCFEILVKWVETRNWEEALYSVIPQRKFAPGGSKRGAKGADDENVVTVDKEVEGNGDAEADAEGESEGEEVAEGRAVSEGLKEDEDEDECEADKNAVVVASVETKLA